jgi:hypothetical protein
MRCRRLATSSGRPATRFRWRTVPTNGRRRPTVTNGRRRRTDGGVYASACVGRLAGRAMRMRASDGLLGDWFGERLAMAGAAVFFLSLWFLLRLLQLLGLYIGRSAESPGGGAHARPWRSWARTWASWLVVDLIAKFLSMDFVYAYVFPDRSKKARTSSPLLNVGMGFGHWSTFVN